MKSSTDNHFGAIAQLVEQRTENPCVPGSIPGGTTQKADFLTRVSFFLLYARHEHCLTGGSPEQALIAGIA